MQTILKGMCWEGLAARRSKANKQARLVERKVCFIQIPAIVGEGGRHLSKRRLPPHLAPNKQRVKAFIDKSWGEVTCRNSTVISNSHLQLVTSGLTSIILVVSGTVNLQFWGALVPISLQSVLRIVAAHVQGTVWSSCT